MMKLSIFLCSAVVFVTAKNVNLTSMSRGISWDERVRASANDSSLQARAKAAEAEVLKNITKYRNYKPTVFGPSVFKIAKEYGGAEVADCMKPVTHEFTLLQENVTKTQTCVEQIKKGQVDRVVPVRPDKPWSWHHDNHLSLLPPGNNETRVVKVDVFMDTYEQSLDTCKNEFGFNFVHDDLKKLANKAGECIERHFENYPTTCFDGKGFALDMSLECVKIKLEIYSD